MLLKIEADGSVRTIYGEDIPLEAIGRVRIERASHVEPDAEGGWEADLTPVGGPVLTGFERRSEALEAELDWLETNWL
jgi:hypothetical protein